MSVAPIGITRRARRRQLRLTQRDAAELAEVPERFVGDVEDGTPTSA